MQNFKLIADGIDPKPALACLARHPDLWKLFTARQDTPGSPHHDTECIVLRGPKEFTLDTVFNDLEADWYPSAFPLSELFYLTAGIVKALAPIDKLGRVMVVNLKAGGHIDEHFDDGAYAAHYERFHLTLQSKQGNWFTCGDEAIQMRTGELWNFRHRTTHKVANLSDQDRIHLIIDARLGQEA